MRSIATWTVRNTAYMGVRLFFLASLAWPIVLIRVWNLITKKDKPISFESTLILVLALHLFLSCFWPVFKFRYFVPMLPLIFIWAGQVIYTIPTKFPASRLSQATILGIILISVITYWRVPSHTSYYDNNELITWRTGESEWYAKAASYKETLEQLPTPVSGSLLAVEYSSTYHTDYPIVLLSTSVDQEIFLWAIDKYDIQYIVMEKPNDAESLDYLSLDQLFSNENYTLFKIN